MNQATLSMLAAPLIEQRNLAENNVSKPQLLPLSNGSNKMYPTGLLGK